MLLQLDNLILLDLQKLSRGTTFVTITQRDLLSSIMTLGESLQDAAQFHLYCCLDIKTQKYNLSFAL